MGKITTIGKLVTELLSAQRPSQFYSVNSVCSPDSKRHTLNIQSGERNRSTDRHPYVHFLMFTTMVNNLNPNNLNTTGNGIKIIMVFRSGRTKYIVKLPSEYGPFLKSWQVV